MAARLVRLLREGPLSRSIPKSQPLAPPALALAALAGDLVNLFLGFRL